MQHSNVYTNRVFNEWVTGAVITMLTQISLKFDPQGSFVGVVLNQRLAAAHLHSMHPANRPGRPAALAKEPHRDTEHFRGDRV